LIPNLKKSLAGQKFEAKYLSDHPSIVVADIFKRENILFLNSEELLEFANVSKRAKIINDIKNNTFL